MAALLHRTAELAELLGVNRTTVWRWVQSGDLPPPRVIGDGPRPFRAWLKRDVEAWLESRPKANGNGAEP